MVNQPKFCLPAQGHFNPDNAAQNRPVWQHRTWVHSTTGLHTHPSAHTPVCTVKVKHPSEVATSKIHFSVFKFQNSNFPTGHVSPSTIICWYIPTPQLGKHLASTIDHILNRTWIYLIYSLRLRLTIWSAVRIFEFWAIAPFGPKMKNEWKRNCAHHKVQPQNLFYYALYKGGADVVYWIIL